MTVPGPSPKSASPLWISYVRTEWWLTTERTRHPSCQRLDHRITGCSPCHPIHFQSLSLSNARIFQHHQMGKHRQRNLGLSSETCETLWHCRQSRAVVTVSNKVSPLTLPLSPSQKVLPCYFAYYTLVQHARVCRTQSTRRCACLSRFESRYAR